MSLGTLARKILGRHFFTVGRWYRSFFLDIEAFVSVLPKFDEGGRLVDIGGGDGEFLNDILSKNPRLSVSLVDISKNIGGMIDEKYRSRVVLYPGMSMSKYRKRHEFKTENYILVSDVLHHIPDVSKDIFMKELLDICRPDSVLIIKDIQPGHIKSYLSLFSDKYVSGDKGTALISKEDVVKRIRDRFPRVKITDTVLLKRNPPNYCLVVTNFKRRDMKNVESQYPNIK